MKKLYIKGDDLGRFFLQNPLEMITQKTDCPVKDCNGQIVFALGQKLAVCDHCKKTIILRECEI